MDVLSLPPLTLLHDLHLLQAEMEQFEIRMRPDQLTCHASQLFDDIAQSLLDFAKSISRYARTCVAHGGAMLCESKPPEPAWNHRAMAD